MIPDAYRWRHKYLWKEETPRVTQIFYTNPQLSAQINQSFPWKRYICLERCYTNKPWQSFERLSFFCFHSRRRFSPWFFSPFHESSSKILSLHSTSIDFCPGKFFPSILKRAVINILSVMFSTPIGRSTKAVYRIEHHRSFEYNHSIPRGRHWWMIHSSNLLQNGSESINKIIIRKIVISIPEAAKKQNIIYWALKIQLS